MIKEGSGAKFKDPRDLVYSLLVMKDNETSHLPLDYNLRMSNLFVRITWHTINRHRNLVIFASIEDGAIIQDLPLWTADGRFGTLTHCLYISPIKIKSRIKSVPS